MFILKRKIMVAVWMMHLLHVEDLREGTRRWGTCSADGDQGAVHIAQITNLSFIFYPNDRFFFSLIKIYGKMQPIMKQEPRWTTTLHGSDEEEKISEIMIGPLIPTKTTVFDQMWEMRDPFGLFYSISRYIINFLLILVFCSFVFSFFLLTQWGY